MTDIDRLLSMFFSLIAGTSLETNVDYSNSNREQRAYYRFVSELGVNTTNRPRPYPAKNVMRGRKGERERGREKEREKERKRESESVCLCKEDINKIKMGIKKTHIAIYYKSSKDNDIKKI